LNLGSNVSKTSVLATRLRLRWYDYLLFLLIIQFILWYFLSEKISFFVCFLVGCGHGLPLIGISFALETLVIIREIHSYFKHPIDHDTYIVELYRMDDVKSEEREVIYLCTH